MEKSEVQRKVQLATSEEVFRKTGRIFVPVASSARHVHLCHADVERLFGPGHQLTVFRMLSQPGQYACTEQVTIVGPKGQLAKVRVLGPERSATQVELSMTVQNVDAADTVVAVNMELARSYQQAMRDISEQLGVKNDISAGVLTRFPDVLTTRHADVDEEQLWEDVSAVTAQALDRFVEMRAAEGAKMKADVENRLNFLEECVGRVETLSAGRVEAYTNRLYEKLKVILEDRDIDDARVLTEAAIFGDKTAVDEETVRLRSHIAQYRDILKLDEPVGRKLDFLTQELNRETNTIGSKCQDLDITRIVVDMKAEIEKIREQIQNLE